MRSGGKNEKVGGYHAVPPPPSLYSNSAQKPRTRSAGADVSPSQLDGEKKNRRRQGRKPKQQVVENGISGDEICTSCSENYAPSTSPGRPYVPFLQRSGSFNDGFVQPMYRTPGKQKNGYSPNKNGYSPSRFTSPVQQPKFPSDGNGQSLKTSIPPQIFAEHWTMSKVTEALQAGRVFSCSVRINPHNRNEAYATIDGLSVDILIDGACAQNRAVEGDVVALLIDPPNLWPKLKGSNKLTTVSGSISAPNHNGFICDGAGQVNTTVNTMVEAEAEESTSSPLKCRLEDSLEVDSLGSGLERIRELIKSTPGRRPTGKVVAILKKSPRREAVVGFLSMKNNVLTLTPVDPKLSKMIVRPCELPERISRRLKDGDNKVGNELLAAYLESWDSDSPLPHAVVTDCLGQGGELESQTAAILFEHAVHSAEFPPEAMACLPEVPWRISDAELARRKDLRSQRVFSIDPVTARDLDDALSVEKLDNGLIRIGVHIADVSHFVKPGAELDKEAQKRSTSVYMIQQVLPMLPRLLCEELCSLNPGVDRLAFSVIWELNATGEVIGQWIGRTVIRSCCKLSYGQAQDMLDGVFLPEDKTPEGFSWEEVAEDVKILHRIAKQRRQNRYENGALRLDTGKLVFDLDDDGSPCETSFYEHKESNMVVEEFMLLANMSVAKVISRTFPDCALLRRHPEPNSRKLKEFEEFCRKHGFALKTDSAAALHSSLEMLKEELKHDPVLFSILLLYATKPMQVAKYFCTGQVKDDDWGHYALAAPVYTHFTSPIRRYPDLVVHRTLAAALEAEKVLKKSLTGLTNKHEELVSGRDYEVLQNAALNHKLPDATELAEVAAHCNERKLASKNVQEATDKLYLWTMLRKKQGLLSDACVVALGPKYMSLYVTKIAMERRIYYDDVDGLKVDWLENTGKLILDYARPRNKKSKGRSIFDIVTLAGLESNFEGETEFEPEALPLTLHLFHHIPVVIHATGGDSSPLDIGVRLYVSSYLANLPNCC